MRKLLVGLLALWSFSAQAQNITNPAPVADSGAYNSSPLTCTSGQFCFLQTDINGNLKTVSSGTPSGTQDVIVNPTSVASKALTPTTSSALVANLVIKGSAGNFYGFEVSADSTLSAAPWWILVFDATTAPVDGAVTPKKCYAMPSSTNSAAYSWGTIPIVFTTGIVVSVSTTGCFTKTASTHAFISGEAQ